jgi:DNA-binding transcriptional ArsR family regulator
MTGRERLVASELLERVTAEIEARRDELRPRVEEYERLLEAAAALEREQGRAVPVEAETGSSEPVSERTGKLPKRTRARRGSAAGAIARAASTGRSAGRAAKRSGGGASGAAHQAILAALEHGSHTVSELAVVTAMSGPSIRDGLRRLVGSGAVARAKRDGKAAYALARSART